MALSVSEVKEWLLVNWRPLVRVVAVLVVYLLVKFYPSATLEKETILAILEITGLGVLGLMPGLRQPRREDDPQ